MNILKKIIYLFLFSIGIGFFITGCKEKKQSQAAFNPELAKLMRTADSLLKQADSSFYRKQEISSTAQKSKFDKEIRSYLDKVIQMAPTYEGGYIQKTAYLNRCHLYEETLQTLRNMHAHIGTSMNAQMISMKAELEDWIGDSTTAQQDFELANNVLEQQMQYLSENSTTRTLYRLQQVLNQSLKENNFSSIKQELDSLSSSILLPQSIEVSKRFHNNKDFYEYYFNKSCFSEAPYGGNELTESIHKKEASMQITTTINKETTKILTICISNPTSNVLKLDNQFQMETWNNNNWQSINVSCPTGITNYEIAPNTYRFIDIMISSEDLKKGKYRITKKMGTENLYKTYTNEFDIK